MLCLSASLGWTYGFSDSSGRLVFWSACVLMVPSSRGSFEISKDVLILDLVCNGSAYGGLWFFRLVFKDLGLRSFSTWCGGLNDKCWFFFLLGFFSAISRGSSDVRRRSSIKRCGSSLNKVRQWVCAYPFLQVLIFLSSLIVI